MLDLYRVARRGILCLESRDSAGMRLAARAGLVDDYEVTAVAAHGFAAGGVANTAVPNDVYRWTEQEFEKTSSSYAPHARGRFVYLREPEIPWSVVDAMGGLRARAVRALAPLAEAVVRVIPSQANLFAFAAVKLGELQPWLRHGPSGARAGRSMDTRPLRGERRVGGGAASGTSARGLARSCFGGRERSGCGRSGRRTGRRRRPLRGAAGEVRRSGADPWTSGARGDRSAQRDDHMSLRRTAFAGVNRRPRHR